MCHEFLGTPEVGDFFGVGVQPAGQARQVVGHALRELLHLAAGADGVQAVAQPLHHGGANTHAARLQGGKQGVLKGIFAIKPLLGKRKQL